VLLFKGDLESEFGMMPFPRAANLIVRGKF
jgi:hypothetical protein